MKQRMLSTEEIKKILAKINEGNASENDIKAFQNWFNSFDDSKTIVNDQGEELTLKNAIFSAIKPQDSHTSRHRYTYIKVAVALAVIGFGALYFYSNSKSVSEPLELVSGVKLEGDFYKNITINSSVEDFLDSTNFIELSKIDEKGELSKISTSKGQFIKITLSDGTKVSLNADTKLILAKNFKTGTERNIELIGEAYFEVATIPGRSFNVITRNQKVTVLGTKFNIKAYPNQEREITSLLEGSVLLDNGRQKTYLKPNEIAYNRDENIDLKREGAVVDIAWRKLDFEFDDEPVDEVLLQLGRWYGLEIDFKNRMPDLTISGKIKRGTSLADLKLILANLTNANYQLDNNVLHVKFNNN